MSNKENPNLEIQVGKIYQKDKPKEWRTNYMKNCGIKQGQVFLKGNSLTD